AVVLLEQLGDVRELFIYGGEGLSELRDRHRGADASDDILALRIREKFPIQLLLTGRRVPGEGHARAGIGSHVPEDHRLDVRSGPEVMRDLVEVSVVYGPLPVPRPEDGGNRLLQLLLRTLWKLLGHPVRVQSLEIPENFAPDRTETSNGFVGSPKRRPILASTVESPSSTCFQRPGGKRPLRAYALQAFVVIVKPGGTGRPSRVISASPAPLPPSRSRMVASPSSNR